MAKGMRIHRPKNPRHRPPTNEQLAELQRQRQQAAMVRKSESNPVIGENSIRTQEISRITKRSRTEEADGNNIFYKFDIVYILYAEESREENDTSIIDSRSEYVDE
ncbi:hypothetical protein INT45_005219 [Circinella minor]|uniref:Uncharacterized protein n=1 Tax=Circinella minor TaxID=1195481 RepID=A0A8H7RQ20_9FUNG|nr:hypothetical protein INT45_005219 [Circinella minor]